MKKRYICKCGKIVYKSTNADTTGNRDTEHCAGCPHLLPWGPDEYVAGQGFVKNVKGHECRMSKCLEYGSRFRGNLEDKTTCSVVSLDFAFLQQISDWIAETYPDRELWGSFSPDKIRPSEYCSNGRYRMSIACAQNKKGIAAKAALLHQFFDDSGYRKDKTPEEEKSYILAAIEAGKAACQRKKENMEYIISENLENDCVYAYAANEFWVYDKQACRWYTSGFCREQYERAKQKLSRLTPEDFLTDSNDYSLLDDYELPSAALDALQEAVKSGKREAAPFEGTNPPTPADADASPCAPGASDAPPLPSQSAAADAQQGANDDLPEVCRGCQCVTCENKDCATPCWMDPKEVDECERFGVAGDDCEDYRPKEDAQCLKKPARNGDAAANTNENAAQELQPEETPITPTNASSSSAPASLADAGAATQSLCAAAPASLAAEPTPTFDYTGLPDKTVEVLHLAATEVLEARQIFVCRVSAAVALAHKELVANCDEQNNVVVANCDNSKHGNRGEHAFINWCASVGLKKDAAYRLLHVDALLSGSTPEEQATLEAASPSLLYAAAKPSAPAELVQAVKDGDITTHKQYQEAMAQLKAEREARKKAEHDAQRYREDSEKAREAAHTYHCQYEQANQQRNALLDQQTEYIYRIEAAEKDKAAAQRRAVEAEKERDGARQALRGSQKQEEKWRARATSVQEQLNQLQAQPIPSTAIDMDEVEQRVSQRLAEERAKQSPEDLERAQQDSRDAYDAFILAARSIDNIWKTLRPQVGRLGALQGNAKNMLLQQLMKVKEDLIHECENRQS